MEANGIVRKVDGLGRIVIPREFRKLHKISLGDPMEISCMDSGEIVLKKMDMTGALADLVTPALPALCDAAGCDVLVCNTEEWIGGRFIGSAGKGEISAELKRGMSDRREFVSSGDPQLYVYPIAGDADVFGALAAVGATSPLPALRAAAVIIGGALQKF